jgi:hypothetical protein
VLIGLFCNWRFPRAVSKAALFGPLISVIAIIFIAGSIIAPNAEKVVANAGKLTLALTLLHGAGFVVGFWVTRLFRFHDEIARTVAIEVGMQNGGMAAMLAKKHFAADPLVGVPSVFCSVVQTLLGSLVAAWWRFSPLRQSPLSDMSDKSDSSDKHNYDDAHPPFPRPYRYLLLEMRPGGRLSWHGRRLFDTSLMASQLAARPAAALPRYGV